MSVAWTTFTEAQWDRFTESDWDTFQEVQTGILLWHFAAAWVFVPGAASADVHVAGADTSSSSSGQ